MKLKNYLFLCCILFAAALTIGCANSIKPQNPLQEKYGPDADYFIGLQELQNKDTKKALRHFTKASTQGSKYIRRRSLEQKIKLGNIKQQVAGAKEYLALYNDDAALIFAGKIFFENKEYALLLDSTSFIDITKCPNELAKMRITAMSEKKDSRLTSTICQWFTGRKITPDHLDFYYGPLTQILNSDESDFAKALSVIIDFRILVSEKDYFSAMELIPSVKEFCEKSQVIPFTNFLVADLGRCYYTSSTKYKENAEYFEALSNSSFARNKAVKYFSLIYAGRINDKSGVYISRAEKNFIDAMNCAPTAEDYDMALWFLLNTNLSVSTDRCVATIEQYASTWKNPYYFTDVLDNLSLLLFTSGKWSSFPKVYKALDGYGDNATTSKFAYITGQLINKGLLKGTEEDKTAAFSKAFELNAGTDIYYRLLAAKELDINLKEIESKIFTPTTAVSAANDAEAEKLLLGYADFGFEDLIYPEWQYFYTLNNKIFDINTICQAAEFLRKCGNSTNSNYYKSLHMVTKTTNLDNSPLTRKVFELSYPKNFSKEIKAACEEFGVEEYDMLGLIRTESFFNPIVESRAGALGLSQLMESTFNDCASRLKIDNANITDPQTNIRVGTYYYSSLVNRLDDSDILALFAYNAGITRVRRWLQSSRVGLGLFKNLSSDLFLETIPISETRNYGRKVIQSAAIYAWLYYDKNPCDIIDEMM